MQVALDVLRKNDDLVQYLADRLVEIGDSVPEEIEGFRLPVAKNPLKDPALFDVEKYPPAEMWAKPGDKQPNRAGFAKWGSYINSYCQKNYGRPLFMVCSADLAGSTNISGFGDDFGDMKNTGWYDREKNPEGVILPQGITEFANAGIMVGACSVNMSDKPEEEFNGYYTACSTYGSFSYLKYGAMRLYSQLAQDCELKLGKVIWVAGHSGPETAEDSRTCHFGIFSPGHHADVPRRPRPEPAPLGVQRGAGDAGRGHEGGAAHHRPAPDAPGRGDLRPRGHGPGQPLRGRQGRLHPARLQGRRAEAGRHHGPGAP